MRPWLTLYATALWLVTFSVATYAEESSVSFATDVQPILANHCFACHGADADARQAELRLDIREQAMERGAIFADDPDESPLVERIFSDDSDVVMPPPETKKPLSNAQKEILKKWIASGANYEPHWAFQRPKKPELPHVKDQRWPQNEIDRFILARLESAGLDPAPPADANVLFRRLHLDITGLPPSPDDQVAFADDYGHCLLYTSPSPRDS